MRTSHVRRHTPALRHVLPSWRVPRALAALPGGPSTATGARLRYDALRKPAVTTAQTRASGESPDQLASQILRFAQERLGVRSVLAKAKGLFDGLRRRRVTAKTLESTGFLW